MRIERVIANLLDNAVSFSPPEREHRRHGARERRPGRDGGVRSWPRHPARGAREGVRAVPLGAARGRELRQPVGPRPRPSPAPSPRRGRRQLLLVASGPTARRARAWCSTCACAADRSVSERPPMRRQSQSTAGRCLIEGAPGSGKSSLGADADRSRRGAGRRRRRDRSSLREGRVWAAPPPTTAGLLEIRNVGMVTLPAPEAPVALVLQFDPDSAPPRRAGRTDRATRPRPAPAAPAPDAWCCRSAPSGRYATRIALKRDTPAPHLFLLRATGANPAPVSAPAARYRQRILLVTGLLRRGQRPPRCASSKT